MKSEYTKGDWFYSMGGTFDKPSVKVKTDLGLLTIATVTTEHLRQAAAIENETLPDGFTANNDEENARLMASSPTLLNVLEKCYNFIHRGANLSSLSDRLDLEKEIEQAYRLATLKDLK